MAFVPEKLISRTRVAELVEMFAYYAEDFDRRPPFTDDQLRVHLATIRLRRGFQTIDESLKSDVFLGSLYETLRSWGIGKRGSRLVGLDDFKASLKRRADDLRELQDLRLDDRFRAESVASRLWNLVANLGIVENEHTVVAGTKCLHHLLPDIVPPMDREFTQTFFGWETPEFQYHPQACFEHAYRTLARIGVDVDVAKYVGERWRSSTAKILDNAVVGYCRAHGLESSNRKYTQRRKAKVEILTRRAKELGIYEDIIAEAKRRAERS
jgi:hypothetical protein